MSRLTCQETHRGSAEQLVGDSIVEFSVGRIPIETSGPL
jgi:hypothetical protein